MRLQIERGNVNRASGTLLILLSVIPAPMSAQAAASPKSPREVLEAYRKVDADGERLTDSGWYRASAFLVKPGRPPQHRVIAVMDGERVTGPDPWLKGNDRAEVSVACSAVGQIDPSGRFTSIVSPLFIDRTGRFLRQPATPHVHGPDPVIRIYDLVLTDTHWEFGPGREGLREVKGPPEWRIETFEFEPWVTVEVAIRYLTRLRDESNSEIIKSNAEKSVAVLRRFREQ